jgi:ankyrin repeat protein
VLIQGGADINAKDSWGHTPLHRAVATGDVETAAMVCAIGADTNAPDVEQRTPLMWAADRLDEEMVRMLLSQGADPTLRDCNRQTAADRGMDRGAGVDASHVLDLLVPNGGGASEWGATTASVTAY